MGRRGAGGTAAGASRRTRTPPVGRRRTGTGLVAATRRNRAGSSTCTLARATLMTPVSSGSRRASSTPTGNSPSSSMNRTPPCARLISPGRSALEPPPTRATTELVWCGDRNVAASDEPARRERHTGRRVHHRRLERRASGRAAGAARAGAARASSCRPRADRRTARGAHPRRRPRAPGGPSVGREPRRGRGRGESSVGGAGGRTSGHGARPHSTSISSLRRSTHAHLVRAPRPAPRRRWRPARRRRRRRTRRPSVPHPGRSGSSRRARARRRTPILEPPRAGRARTATSKPTAIARSRPDPVLR